MPKSFDFCQVAGGKIRTISGPNAQFKLKKGQYRHICIKGGKVALGYTKTKKS